MYNAWTLCISLLLQRDALEKAMDETQKELVVTRKERDDNIRQLAILESRFEDLQKACSRLEGDLEAERSNKSRVANREEEVRQREENLDRRLQEKDRHIEELEGALQAVRQECSTQLHQTVRSLEGCIIGVQYTATSDGT